MKLYSTKHLEKISSISLDKRPEELTIEEFKILTKEIDGKTE
jgi:hypothetical protein